MRGSTHEASPHRFIAREAERRGWSWAYWQFDSDFIVYDIPAHGWIEPIRDALEKPKREQP